MIGKTLIATAAVATALLAALPASEAKADVDVSIGIGIGGYYPGYYGYDGGYGGGYGYWQREPRRVGCNRGANIVDNAGFYRVNPIDCSAPIYAYTAWKRGHKFVVRMNSFGNITSVRKVF
jgi:hypothetical protein